MLSKEELKQKIAEDVLPKAEKRKSTRVTSSSKKLEDVLFHSSTGKIIHTLLSFLDERDKASLAATSVDFRRASKDDRALTQIDFKIVLMNEILSILEDPIYAEQLSISRNPSGFLRLNNDLIKLIKNPAILQVLPDAAELRLNFWPGDLYKHLGAKLEPETGHSHPRGFVSFIVTGGYKHDIFFPSSNPSDPGFMVFKGIFTADGRRFAKQDGIHHLACMQRERVEQSSEYAYFGVRMIHQVRERIPAESMDMDHGTLSINVVFAPIKSAPPPEYDLYMTDERSLVERYDPLTPDLAQSTLEIVKHLLKGRIIELTDSKTVSFASSSQDRVKLSGSRSTLFSHGSSFASFDSELLSLSHRV